ncbi:MAG TPA: hypothetical protein DD415_00410 [Clostridiales bacterium]|nr:hypothetical protein [Clostridiales bacterium]
MNFLRNISLKRKIAAAVCAFLACAAVVAGAVFAVTGADSSHKNGTNGSGSRVEAEVPAAEPVKITPYRNYTAVGTAELYDEGVVVYENKTTVADLKSNLKVVAEYTNGTASGTATLFPEEYTVNVFGTQKGDNAIVAPLGGGNMITVSVTVNGVTSREFTIAVEKTSEIRTYTEISVKVTGNLTEDMDKNAVKSAIEVTGTYEANAEDGTKITVTEILKNRELFSVADFNFTVGSNTITVYLTDNVEVKREVTAAVGAKQFVEASLLVTTEGFRRNEKGANLYEKEIDGKWYSAFVAKSTTTREDVFKNLEIRAIYSSSAEVVNFEWNNTDEATASNGLNLNFSGLPDFTTAETKNINIAVGGRSAGISLQFEAQRVVEIKAEDNTTRNDLYPYTLANSNLFTDKVFARFNDGVWDETHPLTGYTVEGSLAPTKDDIEACINFTAGTYLKELTISYSSELTNNITLTTKAKVKVNRAEITSISEVKLPVDYKFPTQTYREKVRYDGLYVELRFKGQLRPSNAYLEDFNDPTANYITTILYSDIDENGLPINEIEGDRITSTVKAIGVSFKKLEGKNLVDNEVFTYGIIGDNLEINKYEVGLPTVNTTDVPFTEGVSKDIIFAQDENLGDSFAVDNISVTLFANEEDCKNLEMPGNSTLDVDGKTIAEYINGKVNFFAGGVTYYIRVQIKDANSLREEVKWAGLTGSNANAIDEYTIYYKVTVNRGALTVSFDYEEYAWTYGDDIPTLTVKGTTSSGQTYTLQNTEDASGLGSGEIAVPYTVNYYLINSDGSVSAEPSTGRLSAGKYKVVVTTSQTDAYIASTSAQDTVVTVTPRPISTKHNKPYKDYDRNTYEASSFISSGTNNILSGDTAVEVLGADVNGYKHAGEYPVYLNIIDPNYCWAADEILTDFESNKDVVKLDFSIKARVLDLNVENTDRRADFVYGGSFTADNLKFTYTDNGNASETKQSTFYAELNTAEFYKKAVFDTFINGDTVTVDSSKKLTTAQNSWEVGTYVVYYSTALSTAEEDGDYNLPVAYAEFQVTRKAIDKVTSTQNGTSDTYDRSAKEISLTNWTAANDNSGNPILTRSLSAKYFNKDGQEVDTPLFSDETANNPELGFTFRNDDYGTVSVTHAGVYTLTVTLNPNYKWSDTTEELAVGVRQTATITYTVNQAEMQNGSTFAWGELSFTYDTAAHCPVPSVVGIASNLLTLDVNYYNSDNESISGNEIILSGTYYVEIADWKVDGETDNKWAVSYNFKRAEQAGLPDLDAKKLKVPFTINSAELSAPTLIGSDEAIIVNNVKVECTYKGEEYDFTDYIAKYKQLDTSDDSSGFAYGNGQHKILVKIVAAETGNKITAVNGTKMLDTCTYTAYVYPATNFKWGDGVGASPINVDGIPQGTTGFTFTFEIEPFKLDETAFKWYADDNTEITGATYTGYTYNNKTRGLESKVDGAVFECDSGKVGVDITYNTETRKDAGATYTATANKLTGDRAFNYSMPQTNPTQDFVIQKKALGSFSVAAASAEFDGFEHTATVTYEDITYFTENAINLTDVFDYSFKHKFDYTGATDNTLSTENGFVYTNAGIYTITLTLKYTVNFTFTSDSQSFTISPKPIDAPVFKENHRAHEYKEGETFTPEFTVTGDIAGHIEFKYGKCTAEGEIDKSFHEQNDTTGLQQPGQYYVILTLNTENGFYAHNYTINNTKYTDNNYVKGSDETHYGESVYIIQHYAVTNTQLKISFEANDYIFGDNAHNAANRKGIADLITKSGNDVGIVFNADGSAAENVTVNYTFKAVKAVNLQTVVELVNGIPWNAGDYTVTVSVAFSGSKTIYEPIDTTLNFTVSKRVVSVAWSGGDDAVKGENKEWSATYDGKTHKLAASISNMPGKSVSDTTPAPTLIVTGSGKDFKDGGYTLTAELDTSAGAGNFTVEGADKTATLTINKREITVKVTQSIDNVVYGSPVNFSGAVWDYDTNSLEIVEGDQNIVSFGLKENKSGELIDITGILSVKEYVLVPVLTSDGNKNYTLHIAENGEGTYKVVPREITVSLDKNASAGYAESISLEGRYTVTYNGSTDWLVPGDNKNDVFTLAFDGVAENATWLAVGKYSVVLTNKNNGNYKILNSSTELGTFTVTPADITGAEATANTGKVYNAQDYNVISADNSGLITVSATVLHGQPVKWYWQKNTTDSAPVAPKYDKGGYAGGWEEITSKTIKNAFNETSYWIMVAATNHNPQVLDLPVAVKIAKATLKLTVNFTGKNAIYYGEEFVAVTNGSSITEYFKEVSGLCPGDDITSLSGLSGAYSYSAADYSAGNDITTGENYYTITLSGNLSSNNYDIKYQDGKLEVKALSVTVTIKNQTLPYMSSTLDNITDLQALLNGYVEISLNGEFSITKVPDTLDKIVVVNTQAIINNSGKIQTNNVGTYPLNATSYIGVGSKSANYDLTIIDATFEITIAENSFESPFDFGTLNSGLVGGEDINAFAWIYGVNVTGGITVDDGKPTGNYKIVLPKLAFGDVENITYTLERKQGGEWEALGTNKGTIETAFGNWISAGKFNVGLYRLTYSFADGSSNYESIGNEMRYFKVGARDLYVFANDGQTYYGEEFTPTATANGLVFNGNVTDTLDAIMTIEFDVSGYVKGSNVNEYDLSIYTVTAKQNSNYANYNVIINQKSAEKAANSKLTVMPRPVSIKILEKQNRYDFNKTWVGAESGNGAEQAQMLEFTATAGEGLSGTPFYNVAHAAIYHNGNCGNIVKLVTNALDGENGKGTGNLGNYLILALYGEGANGNYAITVTNSYRRDEGKEGKVNGYFTYSPDFYTEKVESYFNGQSNLISAKDGDGFKAGTYKIEPAYLAISLGENTFTYDGKEKGIAITYTGSETESGSIYAEYLTGDNYTSQKPVNVGNYPFRIVVANPDYEYNANAGTTMSLTINRRQISWNVSINGSANPFTGNDGAVYGANGEYRYLGFEAGAKRFNILNVSFNYNGEIADADKFGLTDSISLAKFAEYGGSAFDPFTVGNHSGSYVKADGRFDFAAHNAGKYTVTLTLDGAQANNYTFGNTTAWNSDNTTSFTFTFVISRATVNVVTKDGWVEYGTPLTANGVATARFGGFELAKDILDLVATENTALSGSFDISKVTYTAERYNPKETNAGTSGIYIKASGVSAYNYEFTYNTGTEQRGILTVRPREITVNIHGSKDGNCNAFTVYSGVDQTPDFEGDFADYFKPQGDWYGQTADNTKNYATVFNTGIVISGGAKTDVGVYPLRLQVGTSNYNITYQTANGTELYKDGEEQTVADNARPKFEITKKWLTVQAGSMGMNGDKQFSEAFDITYGNMTEGYFKVEFNGFVNGETYGTAAENNGSALAFKAERGDVTYAPWESHAGEKYIITPSGLDFRNYKIEAEDGGNGWLTATMTVIPRLVTATTEDRTYTELVDNDIIDYNRGESGATHNAQIIFADSSAAEINNSIAYYGFENGKVEKDEYGVIKTINEYAPNSHAKLTYSGRTFGNAEYNGTAAPNKAGDYEVTVELTGDYVLAENTVTLAYRVNKKVLSLSWNNVSDEYLQFNAGDNKQRTAENYIKELMSVVHVTNTYKGSAGGEIIDYLDRNTDGTLNGKQWLMSADGRSFTVNIYGIGLYSATVAIIDSALNNYEWKDSETSLLSIAFRVAAKGFRITSLTLGTGKWTYGSAAPEPDFELDIVGISIGLVYQYAKLNALPDGFDGVDGFGKMLSADSVPDDRFESIRDRYSASAPTQAGIYLLRAYYQGSDEYREAEAYLIFKIEQAIVNTPEITGGKLSDTFTGDVLTLAFGYDAALLTIAYDGTMSVTPDGIAVHATDANTVGYEITFTLKDDKNYRWEEGAQSRFVWIINPAEDNEITSFDVSMLADLTYTGQPVPLPEAEAKYGGEVYFEFLVAGEWTREIPVNAGKYSVRAVSAKTDNYSADGNDALSKAQSFVIKRAYLTVTPAGSAVYGTAFDATGEGYSLAYTGFVDGEKPVSGKPAFMLESVPEKLTVGSYGLTLETVEENPLETVDGFAYTVVKGLSLENYYIGVAGGSFEVTKKQLSAVIGNVNAVYGDKFDLSGAVITLLNSEFAYDDGLASLEISLDINERNRLPDPEREKYQAGAYPMAVSSYNGANYEVAFPVIGAYVVSALDIRIEISMTDGVYGGAAPTARVVGVTTADEKPLGEIGGIIQPQFTFVYYGASNNGEWSFAELDNNTKLPELAGSYTAKAVGTFTRNFNLVNTPAQSFVINKATVDANQIKTVNGVYTGNPLTPAIADNDYVELYDMLPVTYTDAGVWNVTLKLKDFFNYKWLSVDVDERTIPFTIDKGDNNFVKDEGGNDVTITGWTYGQKANSPTAKTRFGNASDCTFEYSSAKDGDFTANVPSTAGTWWVRATMPQSDNYNRAVSEAVAFVIDKAPLSAPSLGLIADGDGKNTVYTGERLEAAVNGFNHSTMRIIYSGDISSAGNKLSVFAVGAATYKVLFALNDGDNYRWADGVTVENGEAVLEWTVARKQIAKPVMNDKTYMVNGRTLEFIPDGFDESTMTIEGNKTSYGGTFTVTVSIKDKNNYEWADSSVEDITFDWKVVGWDTVFVIVASVLGVIAGAAAIAIGVQYLLHRKRKKAEALQTAEAEQAIAETVAENTQAAQVGGEALENAEQSEAEGSDGAPPEAHEDGEQPEPEVNDDGAQPEESGDESAADEHKKEEDGNE